MGLAKLTKSEIFTIRIKPCKERSIQIQYVPSPKYERSESGVHRNSLTEAP